MADTKEVVQKDTTALGVDLDELDDLARPAVYARNFAILARFLKQGRMLTYASEGKNLSCFIFLTQNRKLVNLDAQYFPLLLSNSCTASLLVMLD